MKENIEDIIKKLFVPTSNSTVRSEWEEGLTGKLENSNALLVGIPFDTGSDIRGAAQGPNELKKYLKSIAPEEEVIDLGNLKVIPHFIHDQYLNEQTLSSFQERLYQGEALPVSPLSILQKACFEIYDFHPTKKIFAFGGEHSVSYSLVKSWMHSRESLGIKTALIQFDSQSDLKKDSYGLNISNHSWVHELNKSIILTNRLIQIGLQEHDENASFCTQFTASFVRQNLSQVLLSIREFLTKHEIQEVYISFDISVLDRNYASCTPTPTTGGLEPHHCTYLIQGIAQAIKVTGCDIVEVAPLLNNPHQNPLSSEPNTTLNNSALIANTLLEGINNAC
jgi:agmatinase